MDGDNMGIWLSGGKAPKIGEILHPIVRNSLDQQEWNEFLDMQRPLNPSLHLATSKALRDFSLHVAREIIEKDHLGRLVYAGGDDVLAFVSLRDLLEVMRKLRAYFSGSLTKVSDGAVEIDFKGGSGFIPIDGDGEPINVDSCKPVSGFRLSMGTKATASMGVVIAHHSSNLSQVLEEVRYCEKEAKKLKDKNAFCISLAKRAGGRGYLTTKWYYDDQSEQQGIFEIIPLLRKWTDAFYHDYISPKMAYTFLDESGGLEGLPSEAIEFELLRIADRQRNKNAVGFNKDQMIELVSGLVKLHNVGISLEKIGVFLSVAAFLGREGNR
jgi:CRISPR-associated protein Cmr2